MLKKAGATTLGVAAGMLVLAPAAWAGGQGEGEDVHVKKVYEANGSEANETNAGLVNVSDNNLLVPIQACNNNVPVNVLGVQVPVQDIAAVLGIIADTEGSNASEDDSCDQEGEIDD